MSDEPSGSGKLVATSRYRYYGRKHREKQRVDNKQQEKEQDNDAPKTKTLGLVNRKVLGLELVASPALLAKHSDWDFADWEDNNPEAVVQTTSGETRSSVSVESSSPNNVFAQSERSVYDAVPSSSSTSISTYSGSEKMMNDHRVAARDGVDREGPSLKHSTPFMTTTTSGGRGGTLRKKLTTFRRLGASTTLHSLSKKKNEMDNSFDLSDSLDEPFHRNKHDQEDGNPFNNIAHNEPENFFPVDDADSFFNAAADPASTLAATDPALLPFSFVKEKSMTSHSYETTMLSEDWLLPMPQPTATQVKRSDTETIATDTQSQIGMEVTDTDATPPCTPPKLLASLAGVEEKNKDNNLSEESPKGVQEFTLYQFVQQRLLPSCDDHCNTSRASSTMEDEVEVLRDEVEEHLYQYNIGYEGESPSLVSTESDDVGEIGEETTGLLDVPINLFTPAVSDDNGCFEDDMKEASVKSVDTTVQESLDDHISVIHPTLSNHLEKDVIVDKTSCANTEGGLRVSNDAGVRESNTSTAGVSSVMKKIIFRRKRSVLPNDSSAQDTAAPKSESCKLMCEQKMQDHEDDASVHTEPTEVNLSTDVLSDDLHTGAEELTLSQYLQLKVDGGSDTSIIDNQVGSNVNEYDDDGKEGVIDEYVGYDSQDYTGREALTLSDRIKDSLLLTSRPQSFAPRGIIKSPDITEWNHEPNLSDIDQYIVDSGFNEEQNFDNSCSTGDREVKSGAADTLINIGYSGELDNLDVEDGVNSVGNSRDRNVNNNNGSDDPGEMEDDRIENGMKKTTKKQQQETSWFDHAIDNAVNDVVAVVDEDFVDDMLGIANQAAIVVLKSVRKAIHNIDEVLSGCLEDDDDDESNHDEHDEDDDDDEEDEEEVDDGLNSTDLHFLAAHNYDEATARNDFTTTDSEKNERNGWKKKTKLISFVKLRRTKSMKASINY